MKICVLGLDAAAPEIVFSDERLVNIRRLMDLGLYGSLQPITPPSTVPAWICMCTSQAPAAIAIDEPQFVSPDSVKAPAIWDQLAREGKKSIIIGVPPNYPPRRINGISIGCFLTPDSVNLEFTHPPAIKDKLTELVGEYPVDVKNFRTDRKDWLKEEIFKMSRRQWDAVRWLLAEQEWDYFHFVDIGLGRIHQGFGDDFNQPGNPYQSVVPEYYLWLDEQIGSVLELLDNQTIVLIISGHSAPPAQHGMFVLAAPNCPLNGEYEGARLLDIAPTLLDLAGYEIPETMQGKSLVAGMEKKRPENPNSPADEKTIHDRLAGLGYV